MLQQPDALGNRILDYSSVGYKGGGVSIPNVPVKVTISPVAGDNTANIQAAINAVKAQPLDTNGFRGVVLLNAGEYPCSNTITINASGIVLRGIGSGTNGTVLRATATNQYSLVQVTGSGSASDVSGTTHNITNRYVPVGARSFNVDSSSALAIGDRVFVRRIATSNWIHDIGMDLLCCPPDSNPWEPSGYNIDYDRFITRIEGSRITVNAPITCAIEARYAGGTIRKYTWTGRINNCGVEHIRGISDFAAADDENHGWVFVQFNSVENAWARDLTSQYFGYACVALYSGTRFTTVSDCRSLDPVSQITGGRRYAFVMDDCTYMLVQNCYTDEDRHQFVTQSLTTGPNVFVDGLSDAANADAGPHHRWATGALWDNVTVNSDALNIQNRGNLGSGHGWSGANEVAYNCYASSGYVVQKPPGAHNWLIGSIGSINTGTVYVGPHDPGDYDKSGSGATNVFPNSLYYAQLQDRLAAPNLETREYWVGEINLLTNNVPPGGEVVPVDTDWRAAVQADAGIAPLDGFDVITNGHAVPFTFNFSVGTNERIVAATLSLSMCAASAAAADDVLYLDSVSNALTLASLGWTPVSISRTNPSIRVLDLSSQLSLLADGQLNVSIKNDVGIDWALLELQVAPLVQVTTNVVYPVADATVRGGIYATTNYGTATTLTLKEDSSNDFDRKGYLRWDLSAVTGNVYQAKIRLTPVSVGTDGIENAVAISTNHIWNENSVTWNNQPTAGKRFAIWIPSTNGAVEFVVTPQVLDALTGDKQLAVQLFCVRSFGANGLVDYASREYPDVNARPQLLLTLSGTHAPGVFVWNGPGAGPNNWSTSSSWLPSGPVEQFDDVYFFDPGASGVTVSNINNVVDGSFGGAIASLQYANTNGNHTTLIAAGKNLTVTGTTGLTVGTETDNGNTQTVNTTITGQGGGLSLNGGNVVVRQATDPSNASQRATLNLSGLDTFAANVGRVLVGTEGTFARPTGTLLLAKTNTIVASGSSPAIAVGGAGGSSGNAGGISHIHLGRSNIIFADSISIGRVKQGLSGGLASSLRFNSAFTTANPLLGPTALFRATDGSSRIATWNIADSQSQGGTVNTAGTCDFTGGLVDALVDTMIVGRSSTGSGVGNPAGTFVLHAGTVDVNTLRVGVQGSASANGGSNVASGTLIINGGRLAVNSAFQLGVTAGGTGASGTRGVVNLNAGTLFANSISTGTGTNNTLTVNNASLWLTNSAGPGINLLALTNAILNLRVGSNGPAIIVTNILTGAGTNRVNVFSFTGNVNPPAQFPILKYSGLIGGAGFNVVLGTLPGYCGGYLSNNVGASSVDLIVTNCGVAPRPVVGSITLVGSNVALSGSNGVPNGTYYVLASSNVALPLAQWGRIATNLFDSSGGFSFLTAQAGSQRFYVLQEP